MSEKVVKSHSNTSKSKSKHVNLVESLQSVIEQYVNDRSDGDFQKELNEKNKMITDQEYFIKKLEQTNFALLTRIEQLEKRFDSSEKLSQASLKDAEIDSLRRENRHLQSQLRQLNNSHPESAVSSSPMKKLSRQEDHEQRSPLPPSTKETALQNEVVDLMMRNQELEYFKRHSSDYQQRLEQEISLLRSVLQADYAEDVGQSLSDGDEDASESTATEENSDEEGSDSSSRHSGSASDVPSQSSGDGSEYEQMAADEAERQWKQLLPGTSSGQSASTPRKNSSAADFFTSFVKDVEQANAASSSKGDKAPTAIMKKESKWRAVPSASSSDVADKTTPEKHVQVVDSLREGDGSTAAQSSAGNSAGKRSASGSPTPHLEVHLPHSHVLEKIDSSVPLLDEQIALGIRSALIATEQMYTVHDSRTHTQPFTFRVLEEIASAVIRHVGLSGEFAEQCEDRINDTIVIFKTHLIDKDNCELLGAVIKSVIEKQLDKFQTVDAEEEDSADQGSEAQEEGSVDQLTEVLFREAVQMTTSPAKGAQHHAVAEQLHRKHAEELDELDDTDVFRYIQRTASHHIDLHENKESSGGGPREDGIDLSGSEGGSALAEEEEVYEDEEEGGESNGLSDTPAWLLPKSPLDSVFRKGYGGLGHPDLTDVVTRLEGSPAVLNKNMRHNRHAFNDSSTGSDGGDSDSDHVQSRDILAQYAIDSEQQEELEAELQASQQGEEDEDSYPDLTVDDIPSRFGQQSTSPHHHQQLASSKTFKEIYDELHDSIADDCASASDDDILGSDSDSDSEGESGGGSRQSTHSSHSSSTIDNNVHKYTHHTVPVGPGESRHITYGHSDEEDDSEDGEGEGDLVDEEEAAVDRALNESFNSNPLLSYGLPPPVNRTNSSDTNGVSSRKVPSALPSAASKMTKEEQFAILHNIKEKAAAKFSASQLSAADRQAAVDSRDHDHTKPTAHNTSTSLQYNADGSVKLTGNSSLNSMMLQSFKGYVQQYGKGDKLGRIMKDIEKQQVIAEKTLGHNSAAERKSSKTKGGAVGSPRSSRNKEHVRERKEKKSDGFASLDPSVDYSFADLDELINSNLAKLDALKSPAAKSRTKPDNTSAANNSFSFDNYIANNAYAPNTSVPEPAVTKSWASPRKSHYQDLQRVSLKTEPGVSRRSPSPRTKLRRSKEVSAAAQSLSLTRSTSGGGVDSPKKKSLTIRLSTNSLPVASTTATSKSHTGNTQKKSSTKSKRSDPRPQSEVILSMDSSLSGSDHEEDSLTPKLRSFASSSGNAKKSNAGSKAKSQKSPRVSSLLAPTVTATMRSLSLVGGSKDKALKQQSRAIHKNISDDTKRGPTVDSAKPKRRSSKGL